MTEAWAKLLANSAVTPFDTGPHKSQDEPTSTQKWVIAVVFAVVFIIISSACLVDILNLISTSLHGPALVGPNGTNILGLLVTGIIFLVVVRWIIA